MKKIIILPALLIAFLTSVGQQTNRSKVQTAEDYLLKSKRQMIAACVLLGGGMVLVIIGLLVTVDNWDTNGGAVLSVMGAASEISSIPLFIASGKNKRKAHAVSAFFKWNKCRWPTTKRFASLKGKHFGFNAMLHWQDAFMWDGELANGPVNAFTSVDAQVSYKITNIKSIVKIGGSNIFNHYYKNAFANPEVGGLYYISFGYNL